MKGTVECATPLRTQGFQILQKLHAVLSVFSVADILEHVYVRFTMFVANSMVILIYLYLTESVYLVYQVLHLFFSVIVTYIFFFASGIVNVNVSHTFI